MAERFKVGDENKKSGGDPNVLSLKDQTKIRLVDSSGAGAIAWRQHTIKHADDENQVEFVVCPGPKVCPLCRKPTSTIEDKDGKREAKQNFPVSKRFATNVWDYGSNTVKVLIAGPQVFSEFEAAKAVSIDPTSCDWIVHKMGKGITTKYKMVRDNAKPFPFTDQITPEDMHDLDKYGSDMSSEKIFELLEKAGIDYDAIETQTFTLEEALQFVLPYGKCKGMTVEQTLAQDPDYCEWMRDTKMKDELYFDPIFLVLQTAMEARGLVGPVEEGAAPLSGPVQSNDETPVEEVASVGPAMVTLIAPDGSEQEIPEEAKDALLAAGYTVKEVPEPAPEPETTYPIMLTGPDGSEVPAPNAEAAVALEAAGFTPPAQEGPGPETTYPVMLEKDGAEVEAPDEVAASALEAAGFMPVSYGDDTEFEESAEDTEPTPILADEQVTVTLAGSTLPMAFKAALATAKAGTPVEFDDGSVAEYATLLLSTGGEPPETAEVTAQEPVQSQAEHDMHAEAQEPQAEQVPVTDPEKPHVCQVPGCGWAGKTAGSLTQHMNKQHADVEPPASQAAPAAPAVNDDSDVRVRVKKHLADNPTKDYKKLIALFDEVAGKRDIAKFSDDELLALEAKLQEG